MTPAAKADTIPERDYLELGPDEQLSTLTSRRYALESERVIAEANAIGAAQDVRERNAAEIKERIDPALAELDKRIKALEGSSS